MNNDSFWAQIQFFDNWFSRCFNSSCKRTRNIRTTYETVEKNTSTWASLTMSYCRLDHGLQFLLNCSKFKLGTVWGARGVLFQAAVTAAHQIWCVYVKRQFCSGRQVNVRWFHVLGNAWCYRNIRCRSTQKIWQLGTVQSRVQRASENFGLHQKWSIYERAVLQ